MRERRPTGLIKNRPRGRSPRGVTRAARGAQLTTISILATNQSVEPINDIFIIYLLLLLLLFIYCTVRLY